MNVIDHNSEQDIPEKVATLMKILAEPMRLRLLDRLREKECCVKELVAYTGAGQANVSKHLSLLYMNGIVSRRKEGLYVYYHISDPSIFDLYDCAKATLKNRF